MNKKFRMMKIWCVQILIAMFLLKFIYLLLTYIYWLIEKIYSKRLKVRVFGLLWQVVEFRMGFNGTAEDLEDAETREFNLSN